MEEQEKGTTGRGDLSARERWSEGGWGTSWEPRESETGGDMMGRGGEAEAE